MSLPWSSIYHHRNSYFMPKPGNQPAVGSREFQLVQLSSGVRTKKPEVDSREVLELGGEFDSNQLQISTLSILET